MTDTPKNGNKRYGGGISREALHDSLDYNPATGVFRYKKNHMLSRIGTIAGYLTNTGYRKISINNREYYEHRLAWIYVYGELPAQDIDHINEIKSDNRIANLRAATRSQNNINTANGKGGFLGVKGVTYDRVNLKYRAKIAKDYRTIHLGRFESLDEAAAAYRAASESLFGEYAPTRCLN